MTSAGGPPGAAALAAASPGAGIAGIKGASKEELSELRAELGRTLKELQAAITCSEQEIQSLKTKLEELERRPFALSPHPPPPPQSVTPPPPLPLYTDAGIHKPGVGGGSSISTFASEGGGRDASGGCGDDAVGGGARSGRGRRGSIDESSGPAHSADEIQKLQQQKGKSGEGGREEEGGVKKLPPKARP